jgi:choice-of-anchor B domain-containing protein
MRDSLAGLGRGRPVLIAGLPLAAAASIALAHPAHDSLGEGDPGETFGGAFPAHNIEFLGQVTLAEMAPGDRNGADCWGYVSPSGREYGIMGLTDGFVFVEVTDPIRPEVLEFFSGPVSNWRDVKVYGHYAYGVSEAGIGLKVFDLSEIDDGVVTLANQVTAGGRLSSHNVAINEESGRLYRLGGGQNNNEGLRVYDLAADPVDPPFVGSFSQFYVHDAQIVSYTEGPFAGREIAFCCGGFSGGFSNTRLRIVDVTDPGNMFQVSSSVYPNRGYAHQGWLSEDRRYFYMNDELDEEFGLVSETTTHVFDVSDIASPTWVTSFSTGLGSIDHNLYVKGDMIYQTNYRSGLRVFDASDPLAPVEVAWIDTFPSSDASSYDGAWSSYPYLPSGNILISDIQQGLIVVRTVIDRIDFSFHKGLPEVLGPDGCQNIHVMVMDNGLTYDPSTLRLFVEDAQGVVTRYDPEHLMMYGHTDFWVDAIPCGQRVRFWVECDSTTGVRFTAPSRAPVEAFERFVAQSSSVELADDFQTDRGWTETVAASSGGWDRAFPAGGPFAPGSDFDGSGRCYLTGLVLGEDVDGGSVTLESPEIPFSESGGTLSYAYWLGIQAPALEDSLAVQVSTDGGQSWSTVRTYTRSALEWREDEVALGDGGDAPGGPTLRVRFVAKDGQFSNTVEAAVDAIEVVSNDCTPHCPGDLDGNGRVDVFDFFELVAVFGLDVPTCSPADFDGDGAVSVLDFSILAGSFGCDGG